MSSIAAKELTCVTSFDPKETETILGLKMWKLELIVTRQRRDLG